MKWNWQLLNWPSFEYSVGLVDSLEKEFQQGAGYLFAVLKHLDDEKKKLFIVEILSTEGVKCAEIEGEAIALYLQECEVLVLFH